VKTPESRTELLAAWTSRVGLVAAKMLVQHRRFRELAWIFLGVGLPLLILGLVGLADIAQFVDFGGWLGVVTAVGFLGVDAWGSTLVVRRLMWTAAVGAASQALRPQVAAENARKLGLALRSIASFDQWSAAQLEPPRVTTIAYSEWSASVVRPMLTGPTARRLRFLSLIPLCIFILGFMVMAAAGAGNHFLAGNAQNVALMAGGGVFLVFVATWAGAMLKGRREYSAGYTTSLTVSRGFQNERKSAVDLVDGKTGYLLRAAGAPGLDYNSYWARRSDVRASHPSVRPARIPTAV
jgi:hypothetical protein